jgi:hypothetical protein
MRLMWLISYFAGNSPASLPGPGRLRPGKLALGNATPAGGRCSKSDIIKIDI